MSLLTDREIEQLSEGIAIDDFNHDLARRVEAAVLQKLATVSVAPVAWLDEEFDMAYTASELAGEPTDPTMFPALYPPEAIAAARVQAVEECAELVKQWGALGEQIQTAMRELIGGKDGSANEPRPNH